jgi:hypothetical protein
MDDLIQEVETLLKTKSAKRNWNDYLAIYFKITGNKWNGCSCKAQNLWNWLNNWMNENKSKI